MPKGVLESVEKPHRSVRRYQTIYQSFSAVVNLVLFDWLY